MIVLVIYFGFMNDFVAFVYGCGLVGMLFLVLDDVLFFVLLFDMNECVYGDGLLFRL